MRQLALRLLGTVSAVFVAGPIPAAFAQSPPQNAEVDIPGDRLTPAELSIGLERDLRLMNGQAQPSATAYALIRAGKLQRAESFLRTFLEENKSLTGRSEIRLAEAERDLGNLLQWQGQSVEAQQLLQKALERSQRLADRQFAVITSKELSEVLSSQGKYAEAEPLLRQVQQDAKTEFRIDREGYLDAQIALAFLLMAQNKDNELVVLLRSIESPQERFGIRGSTIEKRVRRLKYLKLANGQTDEIAFRREVVGAISAWRLGQPHPPFPPKCFGPALSTPQLC